MNILVYVKISGSAAFNSPGNTCDRFKSNPIFFFQKIFQLTPPRCVKKIGTFGAVDPKSMEGP